VTAGPVAVAYDEPFVEVFAAALRGIPCDVVGLGPEPSPLPVAHWTRTADASDRAVLAHCAGSTLDIGCGPGRMSAHLAALGRCVLGIDVVVEAVELARGRGVAALCRDVFSPIPGEGRWETALLTDGNIGIGGDPVRLLRRVHALLAPRGRAVVDLAPYGVGIRTTSVLLRTERQSSRPFTWSVVGAEAVGAVAAAAALCVRSTHEYAGRWFAVLVKEA
jgi:SAM-dependent methyltransferase